MLRSLLLLLGGAVFLAVEIVVLTSFCDANMWAMILITGYFLFEGIKLIHRKLTATPRQ